MKTWHLTFEVTRRGGAGETVVLRGGEIWIGRREDCDLVLPADNVARRHCRVEVGGDGVATVTDSGSTNGTFLNGDKVARAPMRAGDCLFVGGFVLKLLREPERIG